MSVEVSKSKRFMLLAGSRLFGVIFSIAIPMYLGRHLEVSSYGTYKQVMLLYWFAQTALNLGLDDSTMYFQRWDRKNFSLFGFNSFAFNFGFTALLALLLSIFRVEFADLLNNPDLAPYLPFLGLLTVLTISSVQIEGFLINLDRIKERFFWDAGTELLKSLVIMGAYLLFDSLFIALSLLSILMLLRLGWMIAIMNTERRQQGVYFREAFQFFPAQIKFGLPLGLSRIVQNILNMDNLFVSSFFSLNQFTMYSVGSFENPLVNATRAALIEGVNIDLVDNVREKNYPKAIETWRRMSRLLFLLIVPFAVYMMFFAKELIVFIFSAKYLESVPYFVVFNLFILVSCLNAEPLFRATSNTGKSLRIKCVGTVLGVFLILGGARWGSPMTVLLARIVAVASINIYGLVVGARLLKARFVDLFVWSDLAWTLSLALVVGAVVKALFGGLEGHPFWILAGSFCVFLGFFVAAAIRSRLITSDETERISSFVQVLFAKVRFYATKNVLSFKIKT